MDLLTFLDAVSDVDKALTQTVVKTVCKAVGLDDESETDSEYSGGVRQVSEEYVKSRLGYLPGEVAYKSEAKYVIPEKRIPSRISGRMQTSRKWRGR